VREVFASYVDQQDNLWIATRHQFGIINKSTGELKNVLTIPGFPTYRIAHDIYGKFWLVHLTTVLWNMTCDRDPNSLY